MLQRYIMFVYKLPTTDTGKNDKNSFMKITLVTTNGAVDTLRKCKVTSMQNVAAIIITKL